MDRRKTGDVIFYALQCAIQDRQSLIDAYSNANVEAVRCAKADIKAFNRVRRMLFGNAKSKKEALFLEGWKAVNILDVRKLIEESPEFVIED